MEIVFTNRSNVDLSHLAPQPAINFLPEWYKETQPYIDKYKKPLISNGDIPATIKKCLPVFDAVSSGYIIFTPADIYVRKEENGKNFYQWKLFKELIMFHPEKQANLHPSNIKDLDYPKFINPWSIKTEKGYSCLITQPMHHDLPFTIFPGIVDTDKYNLEINFVFTLKDPDFEGLIPAGTPMAQIIPIKRGSWKMKIGNKKDFDNFKKQESKIFSKFLNGYKNYFWERKQYS
jgi:hypothetical protein